MTLILMEGFDHYTTLADKGWVVSIYGGITTGRNGNGGYVGSSYVGGNNGNVYKNFPPRDEIILGVALNFGDMANTGYWQLRETGTVHLDVRVGGGGFLVFSRGAGGTVLGTGITTITANTWYFLELRIKVHDSAGTLAVKINGVEQFTPLTGTDTRNGGTAGLLDTLMFLSDRVFATGGQHNWFFDDIYILDVNGSVNNDFIGDCKVETIFPNGNGNSSQFAGSDGNSTDNYLLVDENPANSDTDYVQSLTPGDKDTYAYGNLATATGSVIGVQVSPYLKKTDAGSRGVVSVARVSSTEEDSANKAPSTSYAYFPDIRETKPGGGAWSISDINNAEFGVKVGS